MFADFLTQENILFFVIYGLIFLVVAVITYSVIRIFIKILINIFKKIFYKEKSQSDHGDDLNVVIKELEESKEERAKVEEQKQATTATAGPKLDYVNYPSQQNSDKKEIKKSAGQKYDEKEQKDIASGLNRLKGADASKNSFLEQQLGDNDKLTGVKLGSEIKIPTSKQAEGGLQAPVRNNNEVSASGEKVKDSEIKIKEDVEGAKEDLRKQGVTPDDPNLMIKIYEKLKKEGGNTYNEGLSKFLEKPDVLKNDLRWTSAASEKLREELKNKRAQKNNVSGDNSIFDGKSEISRMNLRQKLRSAKVYSAEKQVGLTLSPVERAKLEKQIFSQSLGGNISKTDLKWSMRKLNEKYLNEKNPTEKGKIRKEIKFFKKIGGIK